MTIAVVVLAFTVAFVAALRPQVQVVASGLNNPRFLAYSDGRFYVTEAGNEPTGGVITNSGSVKEIKIRHDDKDDAVLESEVRLLANFNSFIADGSAAGPAGIRVRGDRIYVQNQLTTSGVSGTDTTDKNVEHTFGHLIAFKRPEHDHDVASGDDFFSLGNIGQFAFDANPGGFHDSDPYGLFIEDDDTAYIADAGAKALIANKNGFSRVVANFPATYSGDQVPSCVAKGPDGFLYVGAFHVFGNSSVFRIDPRLSGQTVSTPWLTNLVFLVDCTFDKHFKYFYGVEFGTSGAHTLGDVARVSISFADDDDDHHHHHNDRSHHSDRHDEDRIPVPSTTISRLGVGALLNPAGIALTDDDDVYVTDGSTSLFGAGTSPFGRVLRVNF